MYVHSLVCQDFLLRFRAAGLGDSCIRHSAHSLLADVPMEITASGIRNQEIPLVCDILNHASAAAFGQILTGGAFRVTGQKVTDLRLHQIVIEAVQCQFAQRMLQPAAGISPYCRLVICALSFVWLLSGGLHSVSPPALEPVNDISQQLQNCCGVIIYTPV